jgi:hypothetical protein
MDEADRCGGTRPDARPDAVAFPDRCPSPARDDSRICRGGALRHTDNEAAQRH